MTRSRVVRSLGASLGAAVGLGSLLFALNASDSGCGPSAVEPGDARPAPDGTPHPERIDATGTDAASIDAGDAPEGSAPKGIWRRVPSAAPCPLSEAVLPPEPMAPRTWTSCGTGCLVGPAWPAPFDDKDALVVGSGGAFIGGETYLYLSNDAQPQRMVVTRLSDGSTAAAARIDSTRYECVFSGLGGDAPLLFTVFQEDAGLFFGRASAARDGSTAWQGGWVGNGPAAFASRFMFDDGHGVASAGGLVDWLPSIASTAFTVLDDSISPVDSTSARGHLLVWNKNDGAHGWLSSVLGDAGAPATLVPGAQGTFINSVKVTDDRVVWIAVGGPQATQFLYTSARLDWMKYATGPFTTQPQAPGPAIPAASGLVDLAAGGDYAATIGCDTNPDEAQRVCHVFVARLSTGKVWSVPQRPGPNSFRRVLAVSGDEVVLAEQDAQPLSIRADFRRIVRLAIAHLDDVVAAW